MITVYHCLSCGKYLTASELADKEVDLDNENGVGGLFPDHHHRKVSACPDCNGDVEEIRFYEDDLVELLNEKGAK